MHQRLARLLGEHAAFGDDGEVEALHHPTGVQLGGAGNVRQRCHRRREAADEALRFARKYGLLQGAGSDAHVLQGVGTGAVRMRRFEGPEEFLLSLRTAEILRRPKSLAYLQSLKWVAQVKEKVR